MSLSPEDKEFCNNIVEQPFSGMTDGECYGTAFQSCKESSAPAAACRLLKNVKIRAEIKRLQDKTETHRTATRSRKRQILNKIMEGKITDKTVPGRIAAVKADNEMTGDNAPIRVEEELTVKGIWDRLEDTTGLPGEKKS